MTPILMAFAQAVTAVPPPVTCDPLLIYFEPGSAHISREGRDMLDRVAGLPEVSTHRVTIDGHSDGSGAAALNLRLAQRRADAVATALAARGVSRRSMTVTGRGTSMPAVPARSGMAEAQNRRVAICFWPS